METATTLTQGAITRDTLKKAVAEALVLGGVAALAGLLGAHVVVENWGVTYLEVTIGRLPSQPSARGSVAPASATVTTKSYAFIFAMVRFPAPRRISTSTMSTVPAAARVLVVSWGVRPPLALSR